MSGDNLEYYVIVTDDEGDYFATPITSNQPGTINVRRLNANDGTAINTFETVSYSKILKTKVAYTKGMYLYCVDPNIVNVVPTKYLDFDQLYSEGSEATGVRYVRSDEKPGNILKLLTSKVRPVDVFQVQDPTHVKTLHRFEFAVYSLFTKFSTIKLKTENEIVTFLDVYAREISKSCVLANLFLIRCGREIDLNSYIGIFREYLSYIINSKKQFIVKFLNLLLIRSGFLGIELNDGRGILFAYRDDSKIFHDGSESALENIVMPNILAGKMEKSTDLIKRSTKDPSTPTHENSKRFAINGFIPVGQFKDYNEITKMKPEQKPVSPGVLDRVLDSTVKYFGGKPYEDESGLNERQDFLEA